MSVLIRDSSGQIRPIYLCLRCHSFTPTATCHRCGSDDTAVVVWTSDPPLWALITRRPTMFLPLPRWNFRACGARRYCWRKTTS